MMTAQTLHLIILGLFAISSGWFFLGGDFARLRHIVLAKRL